MGVVVSGRGGGRDTKSSYNDHSRKHSFRQIEKEGLQEQDSAHYNERHNELVHLRPRTYTHTHTHIRDYKIMEKVDWLQKLPAASDTALRVRLPKDGIANTKEPTMLARPNATSSRLGLTG